MADQKITALTANTTPATTDILPMVDDPSGTAATQKITFADLLKVINSLTADTAPGTADIVATIDDPSGTPTAKKATIANLMKAWFLDSEGDPAAVTTLTPADGTSTYAARRDHAHATGLIRYVCIEIVDPATALTTGNGKKAFHIPADLNGYNLVSVHAFNLTQSSSGNPTFQVYNLTDTVNMLSTALTIDANETGSDTAATPAVIDTAHDDVATYDVIRIDCSGAGTGCKGVYLTAGFQKP
jgi:hypothetical protein